MLGDPANVFPVLSTNLNRHREPSPGSVELSTDIFVKSIRRDASGAYVIDYVLDGADEQVTIPFGQLSPRLPDQGERTDFWPLWRYE